MVAYPLYCISCQSDDVELVHRIEPTRSVHELRSAASDYPARTVDVGEPAGLFHCRNCGTTFRRELPY